MTTMRKILLTLAFLMISLIAFAQLPKKVISEAPSIEYTVQASEPKTESDGMVTTAYLIKRDQSSVPAAIEVSSYPSQKKTMIKFVVNDYAYMDTLVVQATKDGFKMVEDPKIKLTKDSKKVVLFYMANF